jgi:hypothetical protein
VTSQHHQVDQVRRPQRTPAPPHGSREPIDQPVRVAWREGTLTRAEELEALHAWVATHPESKRSGELAEAIQLHAPGGGQGRGEVQAALVPDVRQRVADRARDEQP